MYVSKCLGNCRSKPPIAYLRNFASAAGTKALIERVLETIKLVR
ncbi:MAG: hypothetical protein NTX79_03385 [Candidatus Micrarchaeota archaeon]|nr:hypothetical protein [Candidatus Micrarchaeota archaeon]